MRSFALDAAALLLLATIALVLVGHVRAEPLPLPKSGQRPMRRQLCAKRWALRDQIGRTVRESIAKPPGAQCPSR